MLSKTKRGYFPCLKNVIILSSLNGCLRLMFDVLDLRTKKESEFNNTKYEDVL